jgi:DNA (cytosine-5)-methyltransferase 1
LLSEEYLVIDTRQSDLRLYRWKTPTLRTGRHGILYVRDKKFRKLSGYEALLLQWFPNNLAQKTKNIMPETQILGQAWNAMTVSTIAHIGSNLLSHISFYDPNRFDSKMIQNSERMIPEWRWYSLQI